MKVKALVGGTGYEAGEIAVVTDEYPCDGKYRWEIEFDPLPNPEYDPNDEGTYNPWVDMIIKSRPIINRIRFVYEHEVEVVG
jgi:hypothetical protein